ncbi:MAG: hypothetical protein ACE5IH_10660, partial [Thermodesulfobacteriota bacterium]
MNRDREKFDNLRELFIVICLYLFQGRDEVIFEILGKKDYEDGLEFEDVKKIVNDLASCQGEEDISCDNKPLYESIRQILSYRREI